MLTPLVGLMGWLGAGFGSDCLGLSSDHHGLSSKPPLLHGHEYSLLH